MSIKPTRKDKAAVWSRKKKELDDERPRFSLELDHGGLEAQVVGPGWLKIKTDDHLSGEEALALADWIYDTFGESEE